MGTWQKVETGVWNDPVVELLDATGKLAWLYLLTGPQTNRIGIFCFSVARAARDMGATKDQVIGALGRLRMQHIRDKAPFIFWDEENEVILVTNWMQHHRPDNVKHAVSMLNDILAVPSRTPLWAGWRLGVERVAMDSQRKKALLSKAPKPDVDHTVCPYGMPIPYAHTLVSNSQSLDLDIDIDPAFGRDPSRPADASVQPPRGEGETPPPGGQPNAMPQGNTPKPSTEEPLRFDITTGEWNRKPTLKEQARWKKAYPLVDLRKEFYKATDYLATDKRGPKYKRHPAFLANWFRRAQDTAERRPPR